MTMKYLHAYLDSFDPRESGNATPQAPAKPAKPRSELLRGHSNALKLAPDPLDRLRGPRRTRWGTWTWSDPTAPPIEAFGPPAP
jgi:hypothetical protein